jgi:hypothetical protein
VAALSQNGYGICGAKCEDAPRLCISRAFRRDHNAFQTAPKRLPQVVPHPGPRNLSFVDQNEKRDLISRALGTQIPNPGSARSRAKREFVYAPRLCINLALVPAVLVCGNGPRSRKRGFWVPRSPKLENKIRPRTAPPAAAPTTEMAASRCSTERQEKASTQRYGWAASRKRCGSPRDLRL